MNYSLLKFSCADHNFVCVSVAFLVSFSCFQCVGCGVELFRIKETLPVENGYGLPYHRDTVSVASL